MKFTSIFILFLTLFASNINSQSQLSQTTGFPGINKDFKLLVHIAVDSVTRSPIVDDFTIGKTLADASKFFEHVGANFEECEINIIQNYTYGEPVNALRFLELKTLFSKPHRVNVYFLDTIPFAYCGSSTFDGIQTSDEANIFLEKDCPDGYANQLAHHLGHLFGLQDTYTSGNELVDNSNCSTAGDLICDTPSDPFIRLLDKEKNEQEAFVEAIPLVIRDCEYINTIVDSQSQEYEPDLTNIMSAYPCKCKFTDDQLRKIVENYNRSIFKQF